MLSSAPVSAASSWSQTSSAPIRLGGPVGELDLHVLEAEVAVDVETKLGHAPALRLGLLRRAEDVGVVLAEGAHPEQAMQRARRLVAVDLAELGDPERQVAVALDAALEDLHVAGAIHRLDRVMPAVLGLRGEHVLAEGLPMARCLPEHAVH